MFLVPADLELFADIDAAKAAAMIEDAEATAVLAAPCLSDPTFMDDSNRVAAVKAVLRGAILRWHDAGSGAVTQQGAGPFQQTVDTKTVRKGMFWPSEIEQLRDLCAAFAGGGNDHAFVVDTAPSSRYDHAATCAINLGANYCDCGAVYAGYPIFGAEA